MQATMRSAPLAAAVLVFASLVLGGAKAGLVVPMGDVLPPKSSDRVMPADSERPDVTIITDETKRVSTAIRQEGVARMSGY